MKAQPWHKVRCKKEIPKNKSFFQKINFQGSQHCTFTLSTFIDYNYITYVLDNAMNHKERFRKLNLTTNMVKRNKINLDCLELMC